MSLLLPRKWRSFSGQKLDTYKRKKGMTVSRHPLPFTVSRSSPGSHSPALPGRAGVGLLPVPLPPGPHGPDGCNRYPVNVPVREGLVGEAPIKQVGNDHENARLLGDLHIGLNLPALRERIGDRDGSPGGQNVPGLLLAGRVGGREQGGVKLIDPSLHEVIIRGHGIRGEAGGHGALARAGETADDEDNRHFSLLSGTRRRYACIVSYTVSIGRSYSRFLFFSQAFARR